MPLFFSYRGGVYWKMFPRNSIYYSCTCAIVFYNYLTYRTSVNNPEHFVDYTHNVSRR